MDFFKLGRFRRAAPKGKAGDGTSPAVSKQSSAEESEENSPLGPKDALGNGNVVDIDEEEDDDDDDFITQEVKRRLKELRKNSFMVLIPEESCLEDEAGEEEEEEEEGETSSSEWRESDGGDGFSCPAFDTLYDKYSERMLFFDKINLQQLHEAGSRFVSNPSPRSASKKLALTIRSLSFKKKDEVQDDCERLQLDQEEAGPCQSLETVYVAQICLAWEALHCQYQQLSHKISYQPRNSTCYSCAAQSFQQFQVLLQRFLENEPFEDGSRVEIYVRARNCQPKLLQVPNFDGMDQKEKEKEEEENSEYSILPPDLLKIMEEAILTFRQFLKMDRKKSSSLHLFGGHNQTTSTLQLVQSSLDKKEIKLKEFFKKKHGKKKCWPVTWEEVELLFGLVDIKVVSRVLRMAKITKEQLLWCEEKMSKLDISDNKLHRSGSPVLFPC